MYRNVESSGYELQRRIWIATTAATGIPVSGQDQYFAEVSENLRSALAHSIDRYDAPNEATLFHQFGTVTVTYTVIEEMGTQGSGCTWRVVPPEFGVSALCCMGCDVAS